jgi:hypothetical protein
MPICGKNQLQVDGGKSTTNQHTLNREILETEPGVRRRGRA